ncbi:MAG: dihydrodipicolinate reductase C-terminal domain-containing protein [Candidatus Margulisbacteria bacterium]|nr:dihydrodipicolinate reductase C-terminal domain-containing protein [Candidatus Margulisiibacteriota bacterium]
MKVGLMGFGKTGKAVATILLRSKDTCLEWVIRRSNKLEHRSIPEFLGEESDEPGLIYSSATITCNELLNKHPVDAIIDFSSETGIEYYGEEAKKRKVSIISAISKYPDDKLAYLKKLSKQTRVIHSPNITLGVNFLIIAAKILKNISPNTDIEIIEEHFKTKPEVSGTAKVIAKQLDVHEQSIKTIRAGGIIGTHEILFGFPYQTVRLKHEAISREAFGNGILFAVKNLPDQQTGLFTMEDLLYPYFHVNDTEKDFEKSHKKPWWKMW